MDITAFFFAALALLLVPGPTNTLMGVAGANGGLRHVVRLMPAEIAGYLTTILPLAVVGNELLARVPGYGVALKLVAVVWIMVLAVRLWDAQAGGGQGDAVSAKRIFLTTALNPKALIFALVLLPAVGDLAFALHLILFCVLVAFAALVWGSVGALTRRPGAGAIWAQRLQRVAAVWLAVVSVSLVLGVMQT
ncbi:hypothetical protein E4191_22915 (plasmid) [Paracoccus liaowanqingii]|uniref:LysE family translocator n=1 Tax=Paracoccus liaowanqingii TaxID=2560053 RepID=A0A4Y5STP2_9RHOB|nr:hypothetical protein [Paracoccus liaowanqingii]QDA36902.1 hypothetical protein E4191_22915 [Paracoccus liaowanqingii]